MDHAKKIEPEAFKRKKLRVSVLTKAEWQHLMPAIHAAVFNKRRNTTAERCDYALVVDTDNDILGYVTVHAINDEVVYWQFGGAMPAAKNTRLVCQGYDLLLKEQAKVAKRIFTKIENTNLSMLKLALSRGFIICGLRHHQGETLVELYKELK